MTVYLSSYQGESMIGCITFDFQTAQKLHSCGKNVLFVQEQNILIYKWDAEDISTYPISEKEREALLQYSNEDVVCLTEKGLLSLLYDTQSADHVLYITDKCNSNCIMCPCSELSRQRGQTKSAERLRQEIRHFPTDAAYLTLTGGEPCLLGQDLFLILDEIKEHFPHTCFQLLTNGRAFCNENYLRAFMKHAPRNLQIAIPVHGHCESLHDSITQTQGSFRQTASGIHNLLHGSYTIELRVVVHRQNIDFLSDIADFILQEFPSVDLVNFIGLEMLGNALKNADQVWLPYRESASQLQLPARKLIAHGIDVGIYNYPLCAVPQPLWNLCKKSISDYKVRFYEECAGCILQKECGGIFSSTKHYTPFKPMPVREVNT